MQHLPRFGADCVSPIFDSNTSKHAAEVDNQIICDPLHAVTEFVCASCAFITYQQHDTVLSATRADLVCYHHSGRGLPFHLAPPVSGWGDTQVSASIHIVM